MVDKYYNMRDELGVLVSPGFGAGWSTWNAPELAYDRRVVEKFLTERPSVSEMEEFLRTIGYSNVYMGGYNQLTIEWIPRGTIFCIHEYDGSESIETPDSMGMSIA